MSANAKRLFRAILMIGLLSLPFIVFWQRQSIEDWIKLKSYTPSLTVEKLASEDTMNSQTRRVFYVNHPDVVDQKILFAQKCPNAEQTIVLGCYHGGQNGIFIFDITDKRLTGIEQVTAAHETLHALYDRLSQSEKNRVNSLLIDFYENHLKDKRIIDEVNSYKKTEPGDVVNEMHSIFGTEVANLPAALEDYYKQYFSDRQQIVRFSNQYETVFTQNQQKIDSLKIQIESLKTQLTTELASINTQEAYLNSEKSRMEQLKNSGHIQEYNQAVDPYNAKVDSLQATIRDYNYKVNLINDLVRQYNALAIQQQSLYNAMDTRLLPQSAQ